MSRTGQHLVDIPEATVKVLADFPDFVVTYMRSRYEADPAGTFHRQHVDGFVVLEGEYAFELGDGARDPVGRQRARDSAAVIHRYEHETTTRALSSTSTRRVATSPTTSSATPARGRRQHLRAARDEAQPRTEARSSSSPTDGGSHDKPERTIRILTDLPELCLTWTRYVEGEEGPGPHVHHEHLDAFFILTGELNFGLGPEVERITAGPGTFIAAPPNVIHTFRNDGPAEATWLNFHAPSKGFANFLRDPDFAGIASTHPTTAGPRCPRRSSIRFIPLTRHNM
jgi:quercetin dioxygenase-like cupin family protein